MSRPRIGIVSPFIDRSHGTERNVAEFVSRLADDYELHIYSTRVEDLDLTRVVWHRIPALPGPHLFGYLWWFAANHFWRWRDSRFRGIRLDLLYSPGINCLDADAVSVHVVFARFYESVKAELRLMQNPVLAWPRLIHRRLYYRLIRALEARIYPRPNLSVAVVSRKVAGDMAHYYGRTNGIDVICHGLDFERFSPEHCAGLRHDARTALGLGKTDFALLLVGNDWKNKGLLCLLEAVARAGDACFRVLVVGRDSPAPFASFIEQHGLSDRVNFLPPRPDIEFYYAAADAYAGPSLEDAFAQPPAEAMACGLPAITSRNAGVSETITHGQDGFVLEDPRDSAALAQIICALKADPALRRRIGEAAARTAGRYTWEANALQMRELFEKARMQKAAREKAGQRAVS